ncbi:MAG: hypothetical protein KGQ42_06040 [Alphaproteobacteria bacterium]|nr:hypothetical protein [Alphaproteobacteria bacterium]
MASARDISTKAAVPTSAPVEAPPAEPTQTSSAAQDALGERPNIAPAVGAPDNLRLIKGIGPKLETLCADLGVCRFDQIAAWEEADITEVDRHLIGFHGRIIRDKWVDQAGFLARNDMAGYEARFGKVDRSTA